MGWTSAATYPGEFDSFDTEMQTRWPNERGTSQLDWDTARGPARAAWERVRTPSTRASGMVASSMAGEHTLDNEDVVDVLNDLLETSRDGEQGFRASAEQAQTGELQNLLARRANECANAAAELLKDKAGALDPASEEPSAFGAWASALYVPMLRGGM